MRKAAHVLESTCGRVPLERVNGASYLAHQFGIAGSPFELQPFFIQRLQQLRRGFKEESDSALLYEPEFVRIFVSRPLGIAVWSHRRIPAGPYAFRYRVREGCETTG